jgi:hypothetical protein
MLNGVLSLGICNTFLRVLKKSDVDLFALAYTILHITLPFFDTSYHSQSHSYSMNVKTLNFSNAFIYYDRTVQLSVIY